MIVILLQVIIANTMVEKYDVQAIINDLKEKRELKAEQHDGCYELMQATVNSYAKLNDLSQLDYKDLNLVYLTTVGTWSHGLDAKKKNVNESHLSAEDKEYLTIVLLSGTRSPKGACRPLLVMRLNPLSSEPCPIWNCSDGSVIVSTTVTACDLTQAAD